MKKIVIAALALGLVGSAAFAQTNSVLSRNAVGYVKVDMAKSNLHFVAHNFVDINGGPVTVTNLIGNQLPLGSQVLVWNPSGQSYVGELRGVTGWSPGTNRLTPGRGFWVRVPSGGSISNLYSVYLMGEVPDKTTLPTSTVAVVSGLNMLGSPYPVATRWTNTAIAKSAPLGAQLLRWDPSLQSYVGSLKGVTGWSPTTNVLYPGQGFWFRTTSNTNWIESKPYTWP